MADICTGTSDDGKQHFREVTLNEITISRWKLRKYNIDNCILFEVSLRLFNVCITNRDCRLINVMQNAK
jgi:hypothetical protein